MTSPGLLLLFVSVTGIGFAIGAMNVWSIAMAERHEHDSSRGSSPPRSPPAASWAASSTGAAPGVGHPPTG